MTHDTNPSTALQLAQHVTQSAINGFGVVASAPDLANSYRRCPDYHTTSDAVDALIAWQSAHNFGSGFLTGLGGLATLPIAIPASLTSSWCIQTRMSAAIADLYGYNLRDPQVQTFVFLCLLGDDAQSAVRKCGIKLSVQLTRKAIEKIPGRVLTEINKRVGFRLLTKAGERGLINLTKVVPVVGGIAGGTVDAAFCYAVGRTGKKVFGPK